MNNHTHQAQPQRRFVFDRQPTKQGQQKEEDRAAESRMEDEGGPPLPVSTTSAKAEAGSAHVPGHRLVEDVMTREVRSVLGDTPIKEVALLMAGEGIGGMPVVLPTGRLLGMVTDREIVIRACAGDKSIDDLRASDAMAPDPTGIAADKSVSEALSTMAKMQVHRLPVVDDQFRLIGIISTADVARHSDSSAELKEALTEISNRQSFWSRAWR